MTTKTLVREWTAEKDTAMCAMSDAFRDTVAAEKADGNLLVEHYVTDLLHDGGFVGRLRETVDGEDLTVWWGLRNAGTQIGLEKEYVEPYSQVLFEVTLRADGGMTVKREK